MSALGAPRSHSDGASPKWRNSLPEQLPTQFTLNRVPDGRDVAKPAGLVGIDKVIKRREFAAPTDG